MFIVLLVLFIAAPAFAADADSGAQPAAVAVGASLGAFVWLAVKLGGLITAKVKSEYLSGALARLDVAVRTVVKEFEQTVVGSIKAAAVDGKVTPEEILTIQADALALLKSYLGPKGLAELGRVLGLDERFLDEFLGGSIEAAVHDIRAAEVKSATVLVDAGPARSAKAD